MSRTNFFPCSCVRRATSWMFASETGWPPPALFVIVSITMETRSASGPSRSSAKPPGVHVPLEGFLPLGIERLGDRQIECDALPQLDVSPRRIEVGVRRDDLPGIDDGAEEDAL